MRGQRLNGVADPAPLPSLVQASLSGQCPRCGARTLFAGRSPIGVTFAQHCRACGLDFQRFNVGDGPAAFLILIVGAIVTGLALTLQISMHPPFWVHILLWIPFTLILVLGSLRLGKAALLILEYRNQAREGRIDMRDPS